MSTSDPATLRNAANAAVARGDAAEAKRLFRILLERYPTAPEALDAMYYMTSGHRRPAKRVEPEKTSSDSGGSTDTGTKTA
jgi:hypothetical protein